MSAHHFMATAAERRALTERLIAKAQGQHKPYATEDTRRPGDQPMTRVEDVTAFWTEITDAVNREARLARQRGEPSRL